MQLPIKSHREFLNVSRTRVLLGLASNSYMGIINNNNIVFIIFQNDNVLHKHRTMPKCV